MQSSLKTAMDHYWTNRMKLIIRRNPNAEILKRKIMPTPFW